MASAPHRIYLEKTKYYYNVNANDVPEKINASSYRNGFVYDGQIPLISSFQQKPGEVITKYGGWIYQNHNVTPNKVEQAY